jgi:hypothetical protein
MVMLTTLWKRLGQSRRPSARPAPALGRKSLRLEALEGRLALSGLIPASEPSGGLYPAPVAAQSLVADTQNTVAELIRLRRIVGDEAQTPVGAAHHALHGQGSGEYDVDTVPQVVYFANGHLVFPDAWQYSLRGMVDLAGVGHFEVSGSLHGPSVVELGQLPGGELTFSNACGSLTLRLVGPEQAGFPPLHERFHYRVTSATGAYSGLQASGELRLALKPEPLGMGGTFTLTVGSTAEMTSGIRGIVLEGPISPVGRPGVPNTQPLPGAIISVRTADGKREVARLQAGGDGEFQVVLDPGVYLIVPLPPEPAGLYPRSTPQVVHILRGEVLDLTITFDTGIR